MTARDDLMMELTYERCDDDQADQLIRDYRAEVTAEFVAWLVKKAREHRAQGPQYAKQADAIGRLADQVQRGAVRPNNLLVLPPQGGPEDVPALRARVAELDHMEKYDL